MVEFDKYKYKYTNTQIHKYTNTQTHKYTNTQIQRSNLVTKDAGQPSTLYFGQCQVMQGKWDKYEYK